MDLLERYRDTEFSYPDVGASRTGAPPSGYRLLHHRRLLRPGTGLKEAAEALLTWRAHARLGLRPTASAPRAAPGVTVVSSLGVGPLRLLVPCRVVWAAEEEDRAGFAYGTLRGHPESGEESFMLERMEDGRVWFTVRAFTRPGRWYTRLARPAAGLLQQAFAVAYGRALDRP
ncbi:DUF1990 family protein [Streptosporangium carneum]|uniref:DUF1990 domain-containing protein n=1 Tax=Streptosporangium carneum TaxID=47481 RepID=A0A9W6I6J2_9ACTN|nr:DUF1990 domain-containing protein [Streptosporangium carneum]GLK12164.1 DUF1990 domain-containing protein [Streptosporangium carneum]